MKNIRIYVAFAILAAVMVLLYPREGKFQYQYQKGRPWIYETLIAPIDFPLLKSRAEMLEEKETRSQEVIDYYNFDREVPKVQVERFIHAATESGLDEKVIKYVVTRLDEAYERGIVSDLGGGNVEDKVISVKKDKRISEMPASDISDISRVYEVLKADILYDFQDLTVDSLINAINLRNYIVPNLFYDEAFTQLAHKEAVNYISPTKGMIYAGQLIVTRGETVTSDICEMLDSYKAEYKLSFGYQGSDLSMWLNHIIMVLVMLLLLFLTLLFLEPDALRDLGKCIFFLSVMLVSFLLTVLMFRFNPGYIYVAPFAVSVLFISAFFRPAVTYPVYFVSLLPVLVIPENGIELFIINLIAGALLLFSHQKFNRGWLQFVNILVLFLAMGVVYSAFHIATTGGAVFFSKRELMLLGINSVLVVVLYPFVFLIEKIFSFVSYARLWELSDTNSKLLQMLQHKAPGTFQHSLQVANLAENAAKEVGANAMLVRVGALYHDLGKSENPMCFIENQTEGVEYHSGLSPEESAADIIKHVRDGVAIAEKASLPSVIVDFISSHHGKSVTGYFYNVYCNNGGDPANKAPFTYDGRRPQTKEEAILLLADTVEAASRTLKDYSEETISSLVDKLFVAKTPELAESDITIKEIGKVKENFKEYLMRIYHARIAYPKRQPR